MTNITIPTLVATRYVTPLREGGSLPAVVETEDGVLYVVKFVGAGQGARALISELIAGEIGRALGLRVPGLAFIEVPRAIGETEGNSEIRDLLLRSNGLNLGLRFIPNALEFNPLVEPGLAPFDASSIVWFDAYITNVDRTARNVNILMQGQQVWLIDHGAALYFHYSHGWWRQPERSLTPFAPIRQHALLRLAEDMDGADASLRIRLNADTIHDIVDLIPDVWLANGEEPALLRAGYSRWLLDRLAGSAVFVNEAKHAHTQLV